MTKWDYSEVNDKDRLGVFIGESKKDKYLLKFGMKVYDESCKNLPYRAKLSWNWSIEKDLNSLSLLSLFYI
ncbi:hypothetical protein [Bacillus sp. FJAT-27445]|uniref:hypothetical protein n=1 Tax=Bacillus sp. FJAT-27445 TaxID=1679166 RepID=UPI00074322C4|nr:hypothetical protein [Bacillus sp. FJAT-27445]